MPAIDLELLVSLLEGAKVAHKTFSYCFIVFQ